MRITLATAVVMAIAGWMAQDALYALGVRMFGPPRVTMAEAYADSPSSQGTFSHSAMHKAVQTFVDGDGWVDYAALAKDTSDLDAYIRSLATADFEAESRDGKLALLINAYNAFTLRLIVDYYDDGKLKSIYDIPKAKRWDDVRWTIAGKKYSLNQIEHEWIRKKFTEPRIHFALVCAAESCPILLDEAYQARFLDDQLADQMAYAHTHRRWFRFDASRNQLVLTSLYQWYAGDFEQDAGSVLAFVAKHSPAVKEAVDLGMKPQITYLEYSWRLNDVRFRPKRGE